MKAHPLRCVDHDAGLMSVDGGGATCPEGCSITVAELAPVTPLVVDPAGLLYVPAVRLPHVPADYLGDQGVAA